MRDESRRLKAFGKFGNKLQTRLDNFKMAVNARLLMAMSILTLLVFIVTVVFNILAAFPATGMFLSTTAAIFNTFPTEITPADFTFNIWIVIYVWQFIWIIYDLTFLCRRDQGGGLLCLNPVLLSSAFCGIYILSLLLDIFFLFMFDRELLEFSFVTLLGTAVSLIVVLTMSHKALYKNRFLLVMQKRRFEDTLIRLFVHNGVAIYAAWEVIATFINMAIVIVNRSNPPIAQSTASAISQVLLGVVELVYCVTDLTVLDKFCRYTITPYAVWIWAFSGIMSENFNVTDNLPNSIISAVLLALGIAAVLIKIILVIVRSIRNPLCPSDAEVKEEGMNDD